MANAMGCCIVDATSLREQLASRFKPAAQQELDERLHHMGAIAVGPLM